MVEFLTVTEIIEAYYRARDENNPMQEGVALAALGEIDLCLEDWQILKDFCQKRPMDARLELATRKLLNDGTVRDIRPYAVLVQLLVKSNQLEEARAIIGQYITAYGVAPENRWTLIDLTTSTASYKTALQLLQGGLSEAPDDPVLIIKKTHVIWLMGQGYSARRNLSRARQFLGVSSGLWLWYSNMASLIGQHKEASSALAELIKLLVNGKTKIDKETAFALVERGHVDVCRGLLEKAMPTDYAEILQLDAIFEYSRLLGVHLTAERFAAVIESVSIDPALLAKIRAYRESSVFLPRNHST